MLRLKLKTQLIFSYSKSALRHVTLRLQPSNFLTHTLNKYLQKLKKHDSPFIAKVSISKNHRVTWGVQNLPCDYRIIRK